MGGVEVPGWLEGLPLAPVYYPTETEFADPIAYISKIEKEAREFGICKVVPPVPKPSKKDVLLNLNRSLSKFADLKSEVKCNEPQNPALLENKNGETEVGSTATFTTRHQELGHTSTKVKGSLSSKQAGLTKQVWQSGECYTLNQFENKAKTFSRSYLSNLTNVSPLVIESLFWKAASDKPVYIEYANDVPGSAFGEPVEPHHRIRKRSGQRAARASGKSKMLGSSDPNRLQKDGTSSEKICSTSYDGDKEGTAGWKLSNSPWNLQVIARSRGSLTRFMPDEVPGVTSPMIYIAMLFSWFAWHVEDHELHSMNFLHIGAPKTWYGIPGEYAFVLEDLVRQHCYGGEIDRLAAISLLGEKTTLLSPEVVMASNIPCCRLVQNPGEFVITFPRAYHVGFSHGFNCGEAANFATSQWLKVAKEAAVRRAAMNYLPMLSHQQLLYLLTMSYISRLPTTFLPGRRSSRFKDRIKEERERLVRKAFIDDITKENYRLDLLLLKQSTVGAVLWDPEMLPFINNSSSVCDDAHINDSAPAHCKSAGGNKEEQLADMDEASYLCDEDDLPCALRVESGALSCVACGILGYPFMSIVQPCDGALEFLFQDMEPSNKKNTVESWKASSGLSMDEQRMPSSLIGLDESSEKLLVTKRNKVASKSADIEPDVANEEESNYLFCQDTSCNNDLVIDNQLCCELQNVRMDNSSGDAVCSASGRTEGSTIEHSSSQTGSGCGDHDSNLCATGGLLRQTSGVVGSHKVEKIWNTSSRFLRPRIFCLEHCLEVEKLLAGNGRANILLICHSDYSKIKEGARSVAEASGINFHYKEMDLQTASPVDLELINLAVDDEQQESEMNWTISLGVNLKHCVMLRKMSPPRLVKHALALGGLFSDKVVGSDKLNWVSRKCRSINVEKSHLKSGICKSDLRTKDKCNTVESSAGNGNHKKPAMVEGTDENDELIGFTTIVVEYASSIAENSAITAIHSHIHRPLPQADSAAGNATLFVTPSLPCFSAISDSEALHEVSVEMASPEFCLIKSDTMKNMDGQLSDSAQFAGLAPLTPLVTLSSLRKDTQTMEGDYLANGLSDCQKRSIDTGVSVVSTSEEANGLEYSEGMNRMVNISAVTIGGISDETSVLENMIQIDCDFTTAQCSTIVQEAIIGDTSAPIVERNLLPPVGSPDAILDERLNSKLNICTPMYETGDSCVSSKSSNLSSLQISALEESNMWLAKQENNFSNKCGNNSEQIKSRSGANFFNDAFLAVNGGEKCGNDVSAHSVPKSKKRFRDRLNQTKYFEFVRSPCEGLRPRNGRKIAPDAQIEEPSQKKPKVVESSWVYSRRGHKSKSNEEIYDCDIEGCSMNFCTKSELSLHKRNRCTYEGCGKKFRSHRYAMLHQKVHTDERPLKCKWKACNMTFKWAWALTEHTRVHTGERPYSCTVKGCDLTFRFVSDFSRHRRKTGHSLN